MADVIPFPARPPAIASAAGNIPVIETCSPRDGIQWSHGSSEVIGYRPFGIFRTTLAMLVIVQHVGHVGPKADWGSWATGSIAVLMFFTLSGFVMTEAAVKFYRGRPVAFAMNRFLRIAPLYVISLALSIGAILLALRMAPTYLPNDLVPYTGAELFSRGNLACNAIAFMPGPCDNAAFFVPYVWALRVEVLFYIVVAAAVFIGQWSVRAAVAVASLVATAMFACAIIGFGPSAFSFVPYFVFGIALYFVATKPARTSLVASVAAFLLCIWTTVATVMPGFLSHKTISFETSVFHVALFSLLTLVMVLLMNARVPRFSKTIDRKIGDLSYPIYLQQYAILVLASVFLPQSYWTIALVFPAALLIAWITDWVAERPLRLVRDAVRGQKLESSTGRNSAVKRRANRSGSVTEHMSG